jgi:hypothetical protein
VTNAQPSPKGFPWPGRSKEARKHIPYTFRAQEVRSSCTRVDEDTYFRATVVVKQAQSMSIRPLEDQLLRGGLNTAISNSSLRRREEYAGTWPSAFENQLR